MSWWGGDQTVKVKPRAGRLKQIKGAGKTACLSFLLAELLFLLLAR